MFGNTSNQYLCPFYCSYLVKITNFLLMQDLTLTKTFTTFFSYFIATKPVLIVPNELFACILLKIFKLYLYMWQIPLPIFVISVLKMYRYLYMVLQSIVYGRLKKYVKYRKKQSQEVSGRKYWCFLQCAQETPHCLYIIFCVWENCNLPCLNYLPMILLNILLQSGFRRACY